MPAVTAKVVVEDGLVDAAAHTERPCAGIRKGRGVTHPAASRIAGSTALPKADA
jgi:hypothetical protein